MFIRKRTGELQEFNIEKIQKAMFKAFQQTHGMERFEQERNNLVKLAGTVVVYDGIGIEEIQNKVEAALMSKYPEVAKHFVLRREKRALRRESLKNVVYSSEYLAPSFLINYKNYPDHMNQISKFTYLRTYSRDVVELGRRETYKETTLRSVDHNVNMDNRPRTDEVMRFLKKDAEQLFDAQFNLRGFLSGRALFTGGSTAAEKFPLSLFNCSFIEPDTIEAFYDILYLLSVGAGVGYRVTWDVAEKLPRFRQNIGLTLVPYAPLPKTMRKDKTQIFRTGETLSIVIGDSRDGWGSAIREFLTAMSVENESTADVENIRINFNNIRPAGEPLKTFGGYASGAEPFIQAFKKIHEVLITDYRDSHGNILTKKATDGRLRPIHIMHIANSIAEAIVVGGVRRSAMIALFSRDDAEMAAAKTSFTDFSDPKISHYWLSNNTMIVEKDYTPTREEIAAWVENIKTFGEPGFLNETELLRRHPEARGMNPCAEIILRSHGLCNLVTFNMVSYVKKDSTIDYPLLEKDLGALTRAAYRVTMNELELPEWNRVQKMDRLLGVSPTAWMDMLEATEMNDKQEEELLEWLYSTVRKAADEYADIVGLEHSLNVSAVKPSGTLSLLANSTSAGTHPNHSPYHFRTIRIDKSNPMFKVLKQLNWRIEDDVTRPNSTAVVYFPIKSEAKRTKFDVSAVEQLDRYRRFQKFYTDQNTSVTVSVQNHEWENVIDWLAQNWADFTAVSFLPLTDHKYAQAPYQDITKEEYEKAIDGLDDLSHEILTKYLELDEYYKEEQAEADPSCAVGGACGSDRI